MVSNRKLSLGEWSVQDAVRRLERWRMTVSLDTGARPHAVLRDEALAAIVWRWPVRVDQLYGLPRLPRSTVRRHGGAIIAALGSVAPPGARCELPTLGIDTDAARTQVVEETTRRGHDFAPSGLASRWISPRR